MNRMVFSGRVRDSRAGGWSCSVKIGKAHQMKHIINNLDVFADRLRDVQIDNREWDKVIQVYDDSTTLFYLDPPYLPETRRDSKAYNHEMSREDHERFIEAVREIKGKVLLSGYRNEVYDSLGWTRLDIEAYAYCATRKGDKGNPDNKRTECLWLNYEIQPTLF